MIPEPSGKPDITAQGDRLGSVEERLTKLEAGLREKAIEERLQDLEYQAEEPSEADGDDRGEPGYEGEGQKAFRLALANFLNSGAASQAVKDLLTGASNLIKQHSECRAKEAEAQRRLAWKFNYVGLGFSGLVFILLCALLWYDKIPKELASALIGSLFGFWYGHYRDR